MCDESGRPGGAVAPAPGDASPSTDASASSTGTSAIGTTSTSGLAERLSMLPDRAGVYIFRGQGGQVLYVGKARSLRSRVKSYFQPSRNIGPRKEALVAQIEDLEYIVTKTPVEALIIEAGLIKKHRPRYNVTLRDDKQYPYLRVGLGEEFPSVELVRSRAADGAKYFGPYTRSTALRNTLRTLRAVFPYRSCAQVIARERPCLNHFIGRCLGPCQGGVTPDAYREMIGGLILLMSGRDAQVREALSERMRCAAGELRFEHAAIYRDRLRSLDAVIEGQKLVTRSTADRDVVALAADPAHACAQVFFFRHGRLIGRDSFFLRGASPDDLPEALAAFLAQYYAVAAEIPGEILLSLPAEDQAVVEEWLAQLRGRRVRLRVPQRGEGRRLVDLARQNAELALHERRHHREINPAEVRHDLLELQQALGLDEYPHRIECYDISNIHGQDAVSSMVVLEGGQPSRGEYRRFKLRTPGPDDYAMLAETLDRRLRRRESAAGADSFAILPDLIIVDGGLGQARAAAAVLAEHGLAAVPVFGLAKDAEILYDAAGRAPIALPAGSGALFVLTRLRDEAHRFAVSYHRRLRAKRALRSELDDVPGIGPRRRTQLLRHFGSGRRVAEATLDELLTVPGLPKKVAQEIHARLARGDARREPEPREPTGDDPEGGCQDVKANKEQVRPR